MKIVDFFRKFLKRKNNKGQQLLIGDSRSIMKKFDIIVFEEDEGSVHQKTENGVCAANAQQLAALYAGCGQRIRIIREYDDAPQKPIDMSPKLDDPVKTTTTTEDSPQVQTIPAAPPSHSTPVQIQVSDAKPTYVVKDKEPPKYFNICGTECKFENGKIYQKQWVKILGTEASQYRIISDTNNKEFPLKDKHIEMLKWVLIQDENESEVNNSIKQILNG